MKQPIDLGTRFRNRIVERYPALDPSNIPVNLKIIPVEYRKGEIEKYHVIFWHRLLRRIYEEPLEFECEFHDIISENKKSPQTLSFRKTNEKNTWEYRGTDKTFTLEIEASKTKPLPTNWKYIVQLPSGGLLELGTKHRSTVFYIAQVKLTKDNKKNDQKVAWEFIDLLLQEANRLKGQIFNPIKEFEKQEGLRMYLVSNVYLSNYLSATTMLDIAETQEEKLRGEVLRYDGRTSDMYDEAKRNHISQYMLICGMFYCSCITYFFMALEGFVNLVFHAFLKDRFKDKDFKTDQRFDLEQKLRFMSSLCEGFNEDSDLPPTIMSGFKLLKNYRNSLFHAKVEDSLKDLCFVEDGFQYQYPVDSYREHFLPSHKIDLTEKEVIEVKNTVDEIVNNILESMNQDTRKITETYILRSPQIPFLVSETGRLTIGWKELPHKMVEIE